MHMKIIMTFCKIILSARPNAHFLLKKREIFEYAVQIDMFDITLCGDVFWNIIEIRVYMYLEVYSMLNQIVSCSQPKKSKTA
jgi:hypothetical protein